MTGRIEKTFGDHPSAHIRAAAMVDRWVYRRCDDTLDFSEGELFERAYGLQIEVDRIAGRSLLALSVRLIGSPFPTVKRAAVRKLMHP